MLAFTTDMQAPTDVSALGVVVRVNDVVVHRSLGRLAPQGDVLLPSTVKIPAGAPGAVVHVTAIAFQERSARVYRSVRTTFPSGPADVLLRLGLDFGDPAATGELPEGALAAPEPGTELVGVDAGTPGNAEVDLEDRTRFVPPCLPGSNGCAEEPFVDPATLPAYSEGLVGRGDDPATCFDPARCFLNAEYVEEAKLDRGACTLSIDGSDPARVNVAFGTGSVGLCIRPGECYLPLDRELADTRESGKLKLPARACELATGTGNALFVARDLCAAKTAAQPVCRSLPVGTAYPFLARDHATSVVADRLVASASGIDALATRSIEGVLSRRVTPVPGSPGGHLPWRFNRSGSDSVSLSNGSSTGWIASEGGVQAYPLPGATNESTRLYAAFYSGISADAPLWVGADGTLARTDPFTSPPPLAVVLPGFSGVTAIAQIGGGKKDTSAALAVASSAGISVCALDVKREPKIDDLGCLPPAAVEGKVWAIASGYALTDHALLAIDRAGDVVTIRKVVDGDFTPVVDETGVYRRALVASYNCLFFSGAAGLSYWSPTFARGGVIAPSLGGNPVLGVDVHTRSSFAYPARIALLSAVAYGPASSGGGLYEVPVPVECR